MYPHKMISVLLLSALKPSANAWDLTINYISFPAVTYTGSGNVGCQNVTRYAAVDNFTLDATEPHIAYLYRDEGCRESVAAGSLGTHSVNGEVVRRYMVYRWN
ncbi:hypothetical protein P167DRAFT_540534 [Morchella conica CCBAS932]|uniref:Uncharacterized protein n=1 Tax=Morchella conica CCBAS932 TaxID=1392247 RepID=A0A3N4KBL0_9PEZI|nr:hypothetical protein P167DRAFT_540534 [Morchella conica CCBAS932]